MSKQKVLHVAQSAGGVEVYLKHLVKHTEKDIENVLVCSKEYNEPYWNAVCKSYRLALEREIRLKEDKLSVIEIRRIIKKEAPDVIYLHSSKAGALGRVAALGMRTPVVYNAHGWSFSMDITKLKKSVYVTIEKTLNLVTKKIVCISEEEKNIALKNKICKANKIQVILNGVDIPKDELEQKVSYKDVINIGMVGRLCEQKAPDIFVEMASELIKKYDNLIFTMVGDGPLVKDIREKIEQLGITDKIQITGWVDKPEIYIKDFDIGVLLSRWEGFGLVLAEYMMHKKSVVASNVGAIPSIVDDGVNGYLVPVDIVAESVIAVEKLVIDKKKREQFGMCGYDKANKLFTAKRLGEEHINLYTDIIRKEGRNGQV